MHSRIKNSQSCRHVWFIFVFTVKSDLTMANSKNDELAKVATKHNGHSARNWNAKRTPRVYSHKFSFLTYRIHSEWIRISVVVGVVGWVKREFFIVRQDCGSTIKSITPTARLLPIKRRCHSQLDTTRRYWSAVYCASQHIWFNNVDQPRLHMNEVEFLCISDFRWHRRQYH